MQFNNLSCQLKISVSCLLVLFFPLMSWAGSTYQVPAPYLYLAMLSQVPFSADVETHVAGSGMQYVEHEALQVSRQRMRRELQGLEDSRVTDVLINNFESRDNYGSYGLNQLLEVYWAIRVSSSDDKPLTEADIDSVMDRFRWRDSDWKRMGSERVNGLQAIRYHKVDELDSDTQLNVWFTANEGVLCQIEMVTPNSTAITRFKNIEVGPQPDSVFDVPESYARVSHENYLGWLMTDSMIDSSELLKGRAAVEAIESAVMGAQQ